jgi:hypothetical protein
MRAMTGRCYDLPGPWDQLVVATSDGWVPFDERAATKLAASAMMLACGPEHLERLREEAQTAASKPSRYAGTVGAPSL